MQEAFAVSDLHAAFDLADHTAVDLLRGLFERGVCLGEQGLAKHVGLQVTSCQLQHGLGLFICNVQKDLFLAFVIPLGLLVQSGQAAFRELLGSTGCDVESSIGQGLKG